MSEHIDVRNREGAERPDGTSGQYGDGTHVHDLAAGYALGALDPEDQQQVDDHVAACNACERAIAQAMQTVAMLPFAAALANPPLDAKAQLFTRIAHASRPQATQMPASTLTIPASNSEKAPLALPSHRWQVPVFGRGDRGRFNLPAIVTPLATIPLVLALAVVGSFAMSSQSKVSDLRADLLSAQGDLNDAHETLDTVDGFTASDDAKVYELIGQDGKSSGSAHGKVIANPGTNEAMLMIWRLDNQPKGCRYEVTLEGKDGHEETAAEFGVDSEGHGAAKLSLAAPFNSYMMLHVKRKYSDAELVSTVAPVNDALVATISTGDSPFFDRIATSEN
ncbi:MAG: zf-HC2 domain-containing protein [Thermomicrobiales bacterium]